MIKHKFELDLRIFYCDLLTCENSCFQSASFLYENIIFNTFILRKFSYIVFFSLIVQFKVKIKLKSLYFKIFNFLKL